MSVLFAGDVQSHDAELAARADLEISPGTGGHKTSNRVDPSIQLLCLRYDDIGIVETVGEQ